MMPEIVRKYAAPVPRYTSYPTAPHFSTDIGPESYARWLATDLARGPVSLYLHIPFCKSLCWYCGCNTKATRRYEPIAKYLAALHDEMGLLKETVGHSPTISHIHIGGGSPDILAPDDIRRLGEAIRQHFDLSSQHEFAVEIDPRNANTARIEAFAKIGINRVSFGVQDFDRDVQQAINRHQSYEETRGAIETFREAGVSSINIDLIFGLPKQSRETVESTVEQVLQIKPDRIALFGYAHLPNRIAHQRMINSEDLPGTIERFAQANRAASLLTAAGYVRIGLDHFALPHDQLVTQTIQRNFQGYTTDDCTTLIGLGASSISRLTSGYVQNAVPTATYMREIHAGRLATARGYQLNEDDRLRSTVIDNLMCRLALRREPLRQRFGNHAEVVLEEAAALVAADTDGLIEQTEDGFEVTERGRPFLRSICACFDAYLHQSKATHASGI